MWVIMCERWLNILRLENKLGRFIECVCVYVVYVVGLCY